MKTYSPIEMADFHLVVVRDGTPHCVKHGAMNKVSKHEDGGGIWRCITVISGYELKGHVDEYRLREGVCRAGCLETRTDNDHPLKNRTDLEYLNPVAPIIRPACDIYGNKKNNNSSYENVNSCKAGAMNYYPNRLMHIEYVDTDQPSWAEKRREELRYRLKRIRALRNKFLLWMVTLVILAIACAGSSWIHTITHGHMGSLPGVVLGFLALMAHFYIEAEVFETDPYFIHLNR